MQRLSKGKTTALLLGVGLLLLLTLPALAQSGGGFDLSWHTVASGGGTFSSGGDYTLGGTIGQPEAGSMAGGDYMLSGGFWASVTGHEIQLSNNTVLEGQPVGTLVGTLTTSGPDSDDTFTYSLVSGEGDTDNDAFSISDDQLLTAAVFNYQVKNSFTVLIRSTDQGGLSVEKAFTIFVEQMDAGYEIFLPLILH